ncbi:hypothetical protein [Hymenobacter arizonensis]|uniref:Uncharacterized protein n=1 Tax=Hymenobacter arizonensis TaxID=1227077 RepID=A0A1I5ZX63_HYMAR|nr:hypothetical protein [Hymenobacter arizonensis]SFQ61056.1 hypothetical protein SAMN04515668_3283 [Hymenobacter arizonensis]
MVYFIILFFYAIALATSLLGGFLLRFTRFRSASRYVLGAALGTLPGLVVANAFLWLVLYAIINLGPNGNATPVADAPVWLTTLGAVAVVGAMVLVPIVVTVLGVTVGAIGGMYVAWRINQPRSR